MLISAITYHLTSHQFFTACCWLSATIVVLVFWIASTRSGCTCCHLHKTLQFVSNVMLNWTIKLWTVTSAFMWLLCGHDIEASKDWILVTDLIQLSNTTMPMPCTDVHSETTMSHFWNRRLVWTVRLWILGRSPAMYSKCHACMLVCKMYNT